MERAQHFLFSKLIKEGALVDILLFAGIAVAIRTIMLPMIKHSCLILIKCSSSPLEIIMLMPYNAELTLFSTLVEMISTFPKHCH